LLLEWIPMIYNNQSDYDTHRFVVAISLAEGETIRRILHTQHPVLLTCNLALHTVYGRIIDKSPGYCSEITTTSATAPMKEPAFTRLNIALQCVIFVNCEMYYSPTELEVLEYALAATTHEQRKRFFVRNLQLRRKQRNVWLDTPIAKFFTPAEEWAHLRDRATMEKVCYAVAEAIKRQGFNPYKFFEEADTDHDGHLSGDEALYALKSMNLDLSFTDYFSIAQLFERNEKGLISLPSFVDALNLPTEEALAERMRQHIPPCSFCAHINEDISNNNCCELCYTPLSNAQYETDMSHSVTDWVCTNCTLRNKGEHQCCKACYFVNPHPRSSS